MYSLATFLIYSHGTPKGVRTFVNQEWKLIFGGKIIVQQTWIHVITLNISLLFYNKFIVKCLMGVPN